MLEPPRLQAPALRNGSSVAIAELTYFTLQAWATLNEALHNSIPVFMCSI